ncbi:hypothetical protein NMG60_11030896 [Bertholletia excelsa]
MRLFLFHLLRPSNHSQTVSIVRGYHEWSHAIRNSSSPRKALQMYVQMQRYSIPFESYSILFALKSVTQLQDLPLIRHLHAHLLKLGFNCHVYVATSLLYAYALVSFGDAGLVFDEMPDRNIVTWNAMISGCSKAGKVNKAQNLFDRMPLRNLDSWSGMIACYFNNRQWKRGLMLFQEMLAVEKLKPDEVTLASILSGCAHIGSVALMLGKSVHGFTVKNGWELNVELGTGMVNMYAKCGCLRNACWVFDLMQDRDVMSWTVVICGSAQHGFGKEALEIFERMKETGVRPNELTFTGVLSACAQAGLVEEGRRYFKMLEEYRLKPTIHHYGCMVDMFGKAGLLEEAYELINSKKFQPNVVIWGSLLSACKVHKQFEMAERVIDQVMQMVRPENDGGVYTLISDLYALSDKWDDAERVRKLMVNNNVRKVRGSSFIGSGAR